MADIHEKHFVEYARQGYKKSGAMPRSFMIKTVSCHNPYRNPS